MGSTPLEHSTMVIAIMAAELCTHIVITLPISRKVTVVRKLSAAKLSKKLMILWFSARSISMPVCRNVASARSRKATPKRKSPMRRRFFE